MTSLHTGEKAILLLTTIAAVVWIVWLVTCTSGSVFSQDGVLRFFPVVPIAFIYLYILGRGSEEDGEEEKQKEEHRDTANG